MAAISQDQIDNYTAQINTPAIQVFKQVKDFQTNEYNCYAYMDRILHVVFPSSSFVIHPQAKRPENQGVQNSCILDFIVLDRYAQDHLFIEMKRGKDSRQAVRHQLYRALTRTLGGNYVKFGLTVCGNRFWFWECYGQQQNVVVPGQGLPGAGNDQPPGFVLMVPGHFNDNSPGTYHELPDSLDLHGLNVTNATDLASILRLFNYISTRPVPLGNLPGE